MATFRKCHLVEKSLENNGPSDKTLEIFYFTIRWKLFIIGCYNKLFLDYVFFLITLTCLMIQEKNIKN